MAKNYKVRSKCVVCGNFFFSHYKGTLRCPVCNPKKAGRQSEMAHEVQQKIIEVEA